MFSEIQMLSRLYDVTIDLTTTFGLPVKGALIDMQSISNRQRRPCALRGDFPVGATSSRPCHGDSASPKRTTSPVEGRSFTSRDHSMEGCFSQKQRKTKD